MDKIDRQIDPSSEGHKKHSHAIAMVAACPFPCGRGTPVRIQRMAEGLAKRGHQVHVVTYHLGESIPLDPAVKVHRSRTLSSYNHFNPGPTLQKLCLVDPLLLHRLRSVLRQQPIDVIHAHHVEGLIVALLARNVAPGVPIVFDSHTLLESELSYYMPGPLKKLAKWFGYKIDCKLSGKADYLVAVTDELRNRLLELGVISEQASTTIDNGVEKELFVEHRWSPREPGKPCVIVFTGNLAPYQGIDELLRAFSQIVHPGTDLILRIVTQSSFHAYEALSRELGIRDRIELIDVGFDAVPLWLSRSDIAVNPRVEAPGLPQKTMNYMAAGMPIVSFAGSAQHLVHEQTALLVDGAQPADFARAIERLIDEPVLAAHVGNGAHEEIMSKDWDHAALLVEGVYDTLLSESNVRGQSH